MANNLHACAVLVGDRGVLVTGPSGSGKTQLCLALLDHCRLWGEFGRFVADDQVFLSTTSGRLIASVPKTIAGLIEARGLGPVPIGYEARMVVDLLVRLASADETPRMAHGREEVWLDCTIPALDLPAGNERQAVAAIAARLGVGPFRKP